MRKASGALPVPEKTARAVNRIANEAVTIALDFGRLSAAPGAGAELEPVAVVAVPDIDLMDGRPQAPAVADSDDYDQRGDPRGAV